MKIYDTHSDIFSNLYERNLKGEKDIFQNYHINPLRAGEVIGGIWVVYSEHDFDVEEAFDIALKEYEPYKNNYDVVYGSYSFNAISKASSTSKSCSLYTTQIPPTTSPFASASVW